MKAFIAGIVFLILVGVGGFMWLQYSSNTPAASYERQTASLTGTLQAGVGDDYDYVILAEGKTIGVASQVVDLSLYEGKTVTVTGQYSGTTMYADSVSEQSGY